MTLREDSLQRMVCQGHSISVKTTVSLVENPPKVLFHGTKRKFLESILSQGFSSMDRNWVHLSSDVETAENVASRRAWESVLLEISTEPLMSEGINVFVSSNGVFQVEEVPVHCITVREF